MSVHVRRTLLGICTSEVLIQWLVGYQTVPRFSFKQEENSFEQHTCKSIPRHSTFFQPDPSFRSLNSVQCISTFSVCSDKRDWRTAVIATGSSGSQIFSANKFWFSGAFRKTINTIWNVGISYSKENSHFESTHLCWKNIWQTLLIGSRMPRVLESY